MPLWLKYLHMRKILLLILILVFLFFSASFFINLFKPQIILNKSITIEKGTSIAKIGNILEEKGIIRSAPIFITITKILKKEQKLHYGRFHFSGKYTLFRVFRMLSRAEIVLNPVTIPEGFTFYKIANMLTEISLVDYSKFIRLAKDTTFIYSLNIKTKNLEGFLFPDTYYIPYFADEEYIIKMMVDNFFSKWQTVHPKTMEFDSLYNTVILASIIEKEAIFDDERSLIASVYKNRLTNRMRLQADPTVAYALELSGKTRKKIYYEDLKINSIYNTYKHFGLPPTPICNPGIKSIIAALKPENTNYFFFFAGKNSRHIFSSTYTEHLKKLNRI